MVKKVLKSPISWAFLIFLGCEDFDSNRTCENNIKKLNLIDNNNTKINKKEQKTIEKESFLNEIGFDFENQKVILDLNKTKNFISKVKGKVEDVIDDINITEITR